MAEFEVQPNGEAQRLHSDPFLNKILDQMEASAFERCVNAKPSDDEARRAASTEVRAIRSLRTQLKTLAEGKTKRPKRGSTP